MVYILLLYHNFIHISITIIILIALYIYMYVLFCRYWTCSEGYSYFDEAKSLQCYRNWVCVLHLTYSPMTLILRPSSFSIQLWLADKYLLEVSDTIFLNVCNFCNWPHQDCNCDWFRQPSGMQLFPTKQNLQKLLDVLHTAFRVNLSTLVVQAMRALHTILVLVKLSMSVMQQFLPQCCYLY